MNVSRYDSNSIGTLFASLNRGSSAGSGILSMDLSTYGLIKSGSYGKMMRAYYDTGADKTGKADSAAKSVTSTATSKDSAKVLTSIKGASEDLAESAKALYKSGRNSVFKEKTTTSKDGKSTSGVDRDAVYQAVSEFVDDYNSTVTAANKTNTKSIANAAAAMINTTTNNERLLGSIGIKADSKTHKLSIDEATFKKADMSKIKSAFSGNGSYAYSVAVKASMVNSYAEIESGKANTYGGSGNYTYNYRTGELYNSEV